MAGKLKRSNGYELLGYHKEGMGKEALIGRGIYLDVNLSNSDKCKYMKSIISGVGADPATMAIYLRRGPENLRR